MAQQGCIWSLMIVGLLVLQAGADENNYTQWGDLGDGTYANPVLNGDFADSDIEKFGDTYYLITSTNHLSPGMTIMESQDLINWRYLSHAIPSLSWKPEYNWDRMDGYGFGVWAGDLVRHPDGYWLCYQIDTRYGLTMTKAKDLKGPWSEPVTLLKRENWTDPAVYFDAEKHEAWLLCNWGGQSQAPPMFDQRLFKLSWDGDKLLDEGKVIFTGNRTEASKIRRFHGQWYIMCIEWFNHGTPQGDRKQLCLRSTTDSIYGPYEKRIVFERKAPTGRSGCQGSLIETPDGAWWYMHQLVQNGKPVFQGRPQCLQPVVWKDGWPVIGTDPDGDGTGNQVWKHAKPKIKADPAFALATSDEFDSDELGAQWNWNHDPRNERWSLKARPGWLRITASKPVGDFDAKRPLWKAPNTLSQRHLGVTAGSVETSLDISGLKPGTYAGLAQFSGTFATWGVRKAADGTPSLVLNIRGKEETAKLPETKQVFLRSTWESQDATYSWSVDGQNWTKMTPTYEFRFGRWRGNRHGVFCLNTLTDEADAAGYVDFDWFHYEYSRE